MLTPTHSYREELLPAQLLVTDSLNSAVATSRHMADFEGRDLAGRGCLGNPEFVHNDEESQVGLQEPL